MLLVQWLLCNILFSCWRHYVFKLGWQLCFVVLTQFWNAKHELCFSYLTSHTCELRCILWCRGTIKLGMGVRIMVRFPSAALSEQLRVCGTRPIRQGSQWSDPGHFSLFLRALTASRWFNFISPSKSSSCKQVRTEFRCIRIRRFPKLWVAFTSRSSIRSV